MKKLVFYRCSHCGNVSIKLVDKKVPMFCCGEPMQELNANTTDAAQEKHVPVVTVDGQNVEVLVGSVAHPMTEEHHIAFIVLQTNLGYQVKELDHTGTPNASFVLLKDEKCVTVYEYCNLHGLWAYNM